MTSKNIPKLARMGGLVLAMAGGLALAACVHSGDDPPATDGDDMTMMPKTDPPAEPMMSYAVELPEGHGLNDGTTTVKAGTTQMLSSGTYLACDGSADCVMTVSTDAVTGATHATSTGGEIMASTAASREAASVAIDMMKLTDAQDALDAVQKRYDDGDATENELARAKAAVMVAEMLPGNVEPEPEIVPEIVPEPTIVEVPSGNSLRAALANADQRTLNIAPGEHVDYADVRWSCPEGGSSCIVRFSDDIDPVTTTGGEVSGTATAGDIPNPNPTYGGGDAAGFLSNENLLAALKFDTALAEGSGLDPSGDGFSDFTIGTAITVGTSPDNIGGFPFTGAGAAAGQTVHLYSTVDGGTTLPFSSVYGDNVSPSTDAGFWSKIGFAGTVGALHRQSPGTYTGGGGAVTFGTTSGTLACLSGICTIDSVGGLSGTGTWQFTPTTATTTTAVADTDYITFGWWSKDPGGLPLETAVLWAGSDPFDGNVAALTGNATYNGGAVGHYEQRNGAEITVNRGTFTGVAELTANFSDGRIYGFVDVDDVASAQANGHLSDDLRVNLDNASISGNTFSGDASLSTQNLGPKGGSWNGQFFGDGPLATTKPSSVAGQFDAWLGTKAQKVSGDAGYTNLSGAFGATR